MREAKYPSWQPTYLSWSRMISRCENPKNNRYYCYGSRGIKVSKRWHVYANFLADMGERPAGMSLERKNNNGNYNKRNCKWATRTEQARNKRNNVRIRGRLLCDIAKDLNVDTHTIRMRVKAGWSLKDVLLPKLTRLEGMVSGLEFAKRIGIGRTTLGRWQARGKIAPDFVTANGHTFYKLSKVKKYRILETA